MGLIADIRRVTALDADDRRLISEGLVELALCAVVIARLPFAQAIALGSRPVRPSSVGPEPQLTRCCRVIEGLGLRVPWKAKCFQQGLALQRMLRRRGVDARLHYGIAIAGADGLEAHVWIVVDECVVLGGAQVPNFQKVAAFPGGPV